MKKSFKPREIIIFDPGYKTFGRNIPFDRGEAVLYLGKIPNAKGHCAVAKKDGEVIWLCHPEDFRKARDSEI